MSASDGGPGQREVAYRLFAAEYDDASLTYSESDEERAPNYVVTPTGARVNRLFVAGVLTEVESVNEDVLRGRVADPTGAFVTYAGQYQPDAVAFLDRTTPPAFVALTGKARTFEPEDGDRVFTSVRPESINTVDADIRDRWVVSAAEATLARVAVFAEALEMDERGEDLRAALLARGVHEPLAVGIPRAIDHYGTTPAYLDALRRVALDALAVVAGERDAVRPLELAPDGGGVTDVGAIPETIISAVVASETWEDESSVATESDPQGDPGEPAEGKPDEPTAGVTPSEPSVPETPATDDPTTSDSATSDPTTNDPTSAPTSD
ncbi:MAG: RPA family protein, partial [Halobacteriota archaeon]